MRYKITYFLLLESGILASFFYYSLSFSSRETNTMFNSIINMSNLHTQMHMNSKYNNHKFNTHLSRSSRWKNSCRGLKDRFSLINPDRPYATYLFICHVLLLLICVASRKGLNLCPVQCAVSVQRSKVVMQVQVLPAEQLHGSFCRRRQLR